MIPKECKRLAEVDFPIAVVSRHSAKEKSILSFAKTGSGIGVGTADHLPELATSGTQWPIWRAVGLPVRARAEISRLRSATVAAMRDAARHAARRSYRC